MIQGRARGVAPYAYEAPSSWLGRLAALTGATQDEMRRRLGAPQELDLGVTPAVARALAEKTGVPAASLEALVSGTSAQGFTVQDLAAIDPDTSLRGAVCGACLAEDFAAGRDHYIRWSWVFAWTTTCWRHGAELMPISSLDRIPGRMGSHLHLRVGRPVDDVANPFRIKPPSTDRVRRAPSTVIAFEQALERHRQGEPAPGIWGFCKAWPHTRQVLLDLADFLASRAPASQRPLLTHLYERDGERTGWWTTIVGYPGILLRLDPHRRVALVEGLACVLLDPRHFQIIELHRDGPLGFYRRFRAPRLSALGVLGRMARLDPLTPLLAEASQDALRVLERASKRWPRHMADRLAAASAAAV